MAVEAWETLEDLPSEAKNHPRVLELRVEILCDEEEWEKAEILADSLTRIMPNAALVWFELALARVNLGKLDEGKAALKRAFELEPLLRQTALMEEAFSGIW